jgi:hypothetical protein
VVFGKSEFEATLEFAFSAPLELCEILESLNPL